MGCWVWAVVVRAVADCCDVAGCSRSRQIAGGGTVAVVGGMIAAGGSHPALVSLRHLSVGLLGLLLRGNHCHSAGGIVAAAGSGAAAADFCLPCHHLSSCAGNARVRLGGSR